MSRETGSSLGETVEHGPPIKKTTNIDLFHSSVVIKLLEKHVHKILQNFWLSNHLISESQFGFSEFHTEILVRGGTEQGQSLGVVLPPDAKWYMHYCLAILSLTGF